MEVSGEEEGPKIRRLHHAEHWPVGTIATQLGVDEDKVRRILGLDRRRKPKEKLEIEAEATREKQGVVGPYIPFITDVLKEYPTLRATRIYDMIRPRGYEGSVRRLREVIEEHGLRPARPKETFARLEFLPGEQSQIDWGHVGYLDFDGHRRTLWVFVIVLAWSRGIWAELVLDLTVESLLRSLVRAGQFFGGSTRNWLFDNPKTVVVQRHGTSVRFHPALLNLAAHYHVEPKVCAVRAPNQKGRVERMIRYLRERFFAGRKIRDFDRANLELLEFVLEIANRRPHPDLRPRTVGECLEEERKRLLPLPQTEPNTDLVRPVRVDKTGYVRFDRNAYAVPGHTEETVTMAVSDREVRFAVGTEEIIRHRRAWGAREYVGQQALAAHVAETKPALKEGAAKARLVAACPRFPELMQRWFDAGRNVGSMTAMTSRVLDLYGPAITASAIEELLERGTHDPGALQMVAERLRRERHGRPLPVLVLPDHVPDRDVVPHDLESYDDR